MAVAWIACIGLLMPGAAFAQGLIRDAEIERTLGMIADPIFRAAGLSPSQVDIYIIDNPRMNAFVAGGNNIFIHTGMLRRLKTVDQLRAVIAHETGHITGGHIARRNEKLRQTRGVAGIGALLAVAAAAAGGGRGALAVGGLTQEAALRDFLSHNRAEESSADQASLRYMIAAGADADAIIEVMKMFSGQEILSQSRADPYVRTHPLWRDRMRYLEDRVANAPAPRTEDPAISYWHARMVAKFNGFIGTPDRTLSQYKDDKTEIGALARAVAYHQRPDIRRAMATVDSLIKARPKDPYYWELKGQFLLENGKAGEAVRAYRQSAALAPNEAQILSGLGRALVAVDQDGATREALPVLERARSMDDRNPQTFRDLAIVYARTGQNGKASLATAERFALQGKLQDASVHARRAAAQLPEGSAGWRQAQDILHVAGRDR
ncbi:M48 family metalloprotease [Algicella marina]|nr:M48 family metalloprotease [Algicella marina]